MSNPALASASRYGNVRRARLLRQEGKSHGETKRTRIPRPWSEVPVAGALANTSTPHPTHIRRWHWIVLAATAVAIHGTLVWYFSHYVSRTPPRPEAHLDIEIVRPPKPPEPPKPEPPKPEPPRAPPKQARVLPQIQQSEPLPATVAETSEPAVAVAPSTPEPAPPPPPEPVTEPMGRAGYLNNPAPDYPQLAVRQGWQGTVLLRVRVLASGSVDTVEIKQSSGRKLLDDEAMRTVKRWSFAPAKRGSTPIDGWATVPIEFVLDQ